MPAPSTPRRARARGVVGERLVADHVEPGVERQLGQGGMAVVRRHDRDGLDSVRPRALCRQHRWQVGIATQAERRRFGDRALRSGREHAGSKFKPVVHSCSDPVHRADQRAAPATDQAEPDAVARRAVRTFGIRHAVSCFIV